VSTVTGDPLDGKTLDRMTLFAPEHHPHGMDDAAFIELFTEGRPVVFAFTATSERFLRSCTVARRRGDSMSVASMSRGRRPRRSTWWC
jgi:phosphoketolase